MGGGSKWPFLQLALVVFAFQVAAIGLVIGTGNWGMEPPVPLVKLNPLWRWFGQANVLVPASWFDRFSNAATWRSGVNMMVWTGFQWLGAAVVLDLLRQKSR